MAPASVDLTSSPKQSTSMVRCNVFLPNGKKIRVPIAADAKFAELHQETILRGPATTIDSPYTVESAALKMGGEDAAYFWSQDKISEVIDDAGNQMLHIVNLLENDSSSPGRSLPMVNHLCLYYRVRLTIC